MLSTDKQTNRQTNTTKNITSFVKEVIIITGSTQRAQTSLAEADHYSHMPTVKMLSLGGERLTSLSKKKKFWIITCTMIWLCYRYCGVFFAHLLILGYSDHHQNLIISSLYYPGSLLKISLQSVYHFLSNVVHRQTDKPTLLLWVTASNNSSYKGQTLFRLDNFISGPRSTYMKK